MNARDFEVFNLVDPVLRELGRTGLRLFPVGLGAMPLSMPGGPEDASGIAVIHAALDAGINFIDTANVYCHGDDDIGHNERLIQQALKSSGMTDAVTVAAKGGVDRRQRRVNAHPEFLRKSCLETLHALGREAISLYQLHAPDDGVPFAESIGALARLQEEGKIVHIGLCNVSLDELNAARDIVRIESVQNSCNPFNAGDYADGMLASCEREGISYLPHSVIGGKRFCAKVTEHPLLVELGQKYDASPYAVVIAWHLAKSDRVIPIPGASRIASVLSSAAASLIELSPADVRLIDAIH